MNGEDIPYNNKEHSFGIFDNRSGVEAPKESKTTVHGT